MWEANYSELEVKCGATKKQRLHSLPIGTGPTGTRGERDSMGEVKPPAEHHWGAQTQRSLIHFSIGDDTCQRALAATRRGWRTPPRSGQPWQPELDAGLSDGEPLLDSAGVDRHGLKTLARGAEAQRRWASVRRCAVAQKPPLALAMRSASSTRSLERSSMLMNTTTNAMPKTRISTKHMLAPARC
jgi:hypothetical protein